MKYHVLRLNPVPWTSPTVSFKQRKVYKAVELTTFQEAVREQIGPQEETEGALELSFWFWRRLDAGATGGRRRRAHVVDTTNLQKSLEDALQGCLFPNDVAVKKITSRLVDQGPNVEPAIIIGIDTWTPTLDHDLPDEILSELVTTPSWVTAPTHDDDPESIF